MTEEEEESSLLVAEAVLRLDICDEVVDIVAAVDELTGYRLTLALVHYIAVNVAYIGDAGNDAGTVAVAQTALDVIFFIEVRLYSGIIFKLLA